MNKKIFNLLFILFIIGLIILCFRQNDLISKSIIESSLIFIKKVFPFLFIMMVLNNILINIGLPYYINKIFKNPYIYIIVISILSGCPLNAIILKEYLQKNYISVQNASIILTFTTFNNPLFLFNYFKLIFNNNLLVIKMFFMIYFGNIILFILFAKKLNNQKIKFDYPKTNINKLLIESITKTINNLLNVFIIITFFKLICDILIVNNNALCILFRGIIEITQGLDSLSILNISTKLKELLTLVILSFAGFSIHIQIANILDEYPINYKYFYFSRIFLIVFSFICLIGK